MAGRDTKIYYECKLVTRSTKHKWLKKNQGSFSFNSELKMADDDDDDKITGTNVLIVKSYRPSGVNKYNLLIRKTSKN